MPLALLHLLLRQARPGAGGGEAFGTAQMELMDWMDEAGIEPGEEFEWPTS